MRRSGWRSSAAAPSSAKWLVDHNPRSTNAIAKSHTSGYFISDERFQTLDPIFSAAFAVMNCFRCEVAARVRTVMDAIAAFAPAGAIPPPASCRRSANAWPNPTSPSTVPETLLKLLPFFRTFRLPDCASSWPPCGDFDFSRGQLVYAAGEAPRSCVLIVRGALSMNFHRQTGAVMFAVRGPGQMMGELALLDGRPQPLDCVAREPTILFEIDRDQFELLRKGGIRRGAQVL